MNKHTPGPWRIDEFDDHSICVRGRSGYGATNITGVIREGGNGGARTMLANARLIASAPDLLNVAELVLATADVHTPRELIDAATEAIARATIKP